MPPKPKPRLPKLLPGSSGNSLPGLMRQTKFLDIGGGVMLTIISFIIFMSPVFGLGWIAWTDCKDEILGLNRPEFEVVIEQ